MPEETQTLSENIDAAGLPSGTGLRKSVGHFIWMGGSSAFSQAFTMVYILLITRQLNPAGFGIYSACYSASTLTAFLFSWGLDAWLLRHAATDAQPQRSFNTVLVIKLVLGIVWGFGVTLFFPTAQPGLYPTVIIGLTALDVWLDSICATHTNWLLAKKQVRFVSVWQLSSRGLRLLSGVLMIFLGFSFPVFFVIARLLATGISLVFLLITQRKVSTQITWSDIKTAFSRSVPFGLSEFLVIIYLQADVFLLSLLLGDQKVVGMYSPALSLANALFVLPASFYPIMMPQLARLYEQKHPRLTRIFLYQAGLLGLLGIVLWASIYTLSPMIIQFLLGKEFLPSALLLRILSPILMLKCINIGCSALLIAVGQQKQRLIPQALSALANILLNIILIPIFKADGAAWVYVTSETVLFLSYFTLILFWYNRYTVQNKASFPRPG
jgi:O-antigen/teichoic acid export membrane protein